MIKKLASGERGWIVFAHFVSPASRSGLKIDLGNNLPPLAFRVGGAAFSCPIPLCVISGKKRQPAGKKGNDLQVFDALSGETLNVNQAGQKRDAVRLRLKPFQVLIGRLRKELWKDEG